MESSSKINPGTDIPEDLRARIAKLSPAKRALLELKLKESAGVSAEAAIPRQPKDTVCPLSFSQERLWFLDQFEAGTPVYNQARAMRLTGRLSLEFLKRALDEVVARHEALRTTVVPNDGNPIQKVNEGAPELTIVDLSDLGAAERRAEAEHLLIEKTRRPFDLSRDFMLRAVLIRLHIEEHILLLVTHHIATDAWSSGILWHELTEIYRALVCGERPRLRDLPIQYRDYAVWQRNILTGERLKAQLAYWSRKLANCPVLELPTDRPRPAVQTFAGAYRARTLPPDVCEELRGLSRRRGGTLFMTLLAALQVLLSRYSGQEEIAVGSPIAGRNRPEVEGLIGFFVNTLVLRADLSKNPTFSEFLGRVRETALDAYAHQDVPFEKIVEELRVERNLGYSPLFQVMFAHQNVPREPVDMPGLTLEPVMVDHGTAKFDLTLFTIEDRVGLKMIMEYNRDLFDADTIERMLEHFETLLRDIARDPEQRLSRLNLLTEREKRELAAERNATRTDHPAERCVHELFEAQARREPGRVAVSFGEEEASYGELEGRSNQVARYLRKVGVGPGVLVGVFMERSVEMVVGLLGILKAGGAYVPLDPSYPKDRLRFMIEDAGVGVLLTQERLVESLPARAARVVRVDAEWERIGRESRELEAVGVSADQLAYVIYTSGSTGKPKGVEVTHGSVVNFLSSMRREPGLCERDVLVAVTTLSFDIAGLELFLPLTVGARVVLVSREVASDGMRLAEAMAGAGGTVMQATPATWQMLLEAGWQGSKDLKIFCGGEALSGGLAGKLLERCSSLWNLYGPTETTIWSAVHKIDSAAGAIPIGGPIDNTQIYILDRYLNLVPVGVPGELYIG
ncbi:MAG TPA: condensation domain-containing protein, partial [Candidatus Eisenbacteria bacterium]|nr:condensation domain-containing protein [Candidatus Eisenbacteria bacterium]